MLGISDATPHRRLNDFNLEISYSFSTGYDNTLDGILIERNHLGNWSPEKDCC